MVVFVIGLKVFRQIFDPLCEDCNLTSLRPCSFISAALRSGVIDIVYLHYVYTFKTRLGLN